MNNQDGMNYSPKGKLNPVVEKGEFIFSVIGLDHGHIYGMTNGLIEAGATLKWVYDPDPKKVDVFLKKYRLSTKNVARSEEEILTDPEVKLVASACVPVDRAFLGIRVMNAGKDYFVDKAPFTTLEQLDAIKDAIKKTGKKYMVYYSERLHVESAVYAGYLIEQGTIGKVIQVLGMGPHRINIPSRPKWFFEKDKYGGILCDIGSHQIEQFLYFTGSSDARVTNSRIANYDHPEYPELDDFGDASLVGNNGACGYFRVDWFTPNGLSTWGDGRMFILGTKGYIELRKYIDVARENKTDNVYWVDQKGEHYLNVQGKVGFPFFGQLILDCIYRTDKAMTQEHALKAGELAVKAQLSAEKVQ